MRSTTPGPVGRRNREPAGPWPAAAAQLNKPRFRYYLFDEAGELVGAVEAPAKLCRGDLVAPSSVSGTPQWRVLGALGRAVTVVPLWTAAGGDSQRSD